MGMFKSAFEKAMEKAERLGRASPEELKRMDHIPRGNAIAAKYLRGEVTNLLSEFSQYDADVREYLVEGALETLLRNICLPRDTRTKQTSSKALEGILALKQNKEFVRDVFDNIEHLFTYYEAALQQAFARLRQEIEARFSDTKKAVEQQLGSAVEIDVERQPQFQEEWRKARAGLDAQYEKVLEEHKQRLLISA